MSQNMTKTKLRTPISVKYPRLRPLIIIARKTGKNLQYLKPKYRIRYKNDVDDFGFRISKHKSLLRRKLGDADPVLQEKKIKNLAIACEKFNNLVIEPNHIFSFWKILGEPTYKNGFGDGMLIDNGKVVIGVGGGLCQMANLLYWIALHSPLQVIEHHHHQVDIFPDSGRVLPFGTGAGVLYNYGDLQFLNTTHQRLLIKTWLDDKNLYGEIWSEDFFDKTYSIVEKDHKFYKSELDGNIYRTNKIYRTTMLRLGGIKVKEELITVNDSRVLYEVDPSLLSKEE